MTVCSFLIHEAIESEQQQKKNVTRRRKEKNSQFEKVTTRGASHHQRVSLNTNNNNKRWEGTVSRGPQRGGKENGQRSLTSFQQKKKNLWECSTATVKRSSSWEKVFLFFLIILLPETTFVIREWNRKCRIFHQPKRQQRIHLSGLLKKKNDYMYIFDHEVHAQPCGAKRGRKVGDRYASLYSPFDG